MNRTHALFAAAIAATFLAAGADAKRLGGGKTSAVSTAKPAAAAPAAPAASATAAKPAAPAATAPTAPPAPPPSATKKVVAAAAVGAAAGVVAGAAMAGSAPNSAAASDASAQQGAATMQVTAGAPAGGRIDATEARLRKMDAEAAKPKDATPVKTAAERRREKAEADQKARMEAAAEMKRVKLAREMSCQIKPVMTDAEIANCRNVWR